MEHAYGTFQPSPQLVGRNCCCEKVREMSRALNLSMTLTQVDRHCRENGIAISALEALPDGGTRLVCMSNYGAAQIRTKLSSRIIEGPVRRERFRPLKPMW